MNKNETDKFNLMYEELNEKMTRMLSLLNINQSTQESPKETNPEVSSIKEINVKLLNLYENFSEVLKTRMDAINEKQNQILKKTEAVHSEISNPKYSNEKTEKCNYIKIDFKSLKILLTITTIGFIFLLSVTCNFKLIQKNKILKDSDLKYQFIRKSDGINKKELFILDKLFYPKRDKEAIKRLQKSINDDTE